MDTPYFLDKFTKGADQIDRNLLRHYEMDYSVGVWLRSVALKMQKRSWLNPVSTARPFEESIFFSIWINDETILESKLNYNIHALHIRELTAYSIKSREFAAAFRAGFSKLKTGGRTSALISAPLPSWKDGSASTCTILKKR